MIKMMSDNVNTIIDKMITISIGSFVASSSNVINNVLS